MSNRRYGWLTLSGATGMVDTAGRSAWWVGAPVILRSLALASWMVAAAGPRIGGDRVRAQEGGIAIIIALDVSSSMLAEDFAPSNRLAVAKRERGGRACGEVLAGSQDQRAAACRIVRAWDCSPGLGGRGRLVPPR